MSTTLKGDRIKIPQSTSNPSSPADGDLYYNSSEDALKMYMGGSWQKVKGAFNAIGGTTYDFASYRVHAFTSSGTFEVTAGQGSVDVLIVGGGGAGGENNGGGGGAGGLIYRPGVVVTPGQYTVTVGAGNTNSQRNLGSAGTPGGRSYTTTYAGGSSSAFGLTALGGGNGGGDDYDGAQGGSGGGGADNPTRYGGTGLQPSRSGDSGTYGYGNRGGNTNNVNNSGGCGGGGANAAGADGSASAGGAGKDMSGEFGTTYGQSGYFAGGGGGGTHPGFTSGTRAGGIGGGGVGSSSPGAGQANTGGGGGGKTDGGKGANGGSGIVLIRYEV